VDAHSREKDFFISYRSTDQSWAEWIAWELEKAGYTTFVQAWDFQAGQNFVHQMQQGASSCRRTIAVLTPAYLESGFTQAEWYSAFAKDPTGKERLLLPIRVAECDIEGLLGQIIHIDLAGLGEAEARERLLTKVKGTRARPTQPPRFPGDPSAERLKPAFPSPQHSSQDPPSTPVQPGGSAGATHPAQQCRAVLDQRRSGAIRPTRSTSAWKLGWVPSSIRGSKSSSCRTLPASHCQSIPGSPTFSRTSGVYC
jgi:TIR domain